MKERYDLIDIVKGIAIIMVILVHYEQSFHLCKGFSYLQMGCPIFFLCSGFGIMNWWERYENVNRENCMAFYKSRIKSLWPAWTFTILIIYLCNSFTLKFLGKTISFGRNRSPIAIICNLLFMNGLLPFCNNNVVAGGWYIGTTVILYIISPLVVYKMRNKNRYIFATISCISGMLVWLILFCNWKEFSNEWFSNFYFLVHYPEYLLGVILFQNVKRNKFKICRNYIRGVLGFILIFFSVLLFYTDFGGNYILSAWSISIGTYFLISIGLIKKSSYKKMKWKLLILFGKKSYYLYLVHAFVVWTFMGGIIRIFKHWSINVVSPLCMILFIPIVLTITYILGIGFEKFMKSMQEIIKSKIVW